MISKECWTIRAGLLLLVTAFFLNPGHASERPNILLIIVDDLGIGDLGIQGAKDIKTPHIDQLFNEGMRFDNFYANCPVCSPTRAATLTGRYPDLVGVPGVIRTHSENSWGYLSQSALLLPQLLQSLDYHTAIVGKWHLGLRSENHPNARGFDHFHGFLGDMMDDYYNHRRHGNNYMRLNREVITPQGHATDLFSEWAVDYIREREKKEGADPWFLYLAYNAPHTPIQPPQDWYERVRKERPDLAEARAKLVALIEHMDAGIGTVLKALADSPAAEDTLTIFVSDNGGQLNVGANNAPYRSGKQHMYEGGLRVPFAVRWPGRIQAGARSGAVGVTMDILPSLCEITEAPTPSLTDGVSLAPIWMGEPGTGLPNRPIVFVRREGGPYRGQEYYAIREGDWKLLHDNPFTPYELYNLAEDPGETNDVFGSQPQVARRLSAALQKHIQRAGAVVWQKP